MTERRAHAIGVAQERRCCSDRRAPADRRTGDRRTAERRYHLTEESCRAMVSDMIAFFSGEREPFFTFVDARSLDA